MTRFLFIQISLYIPVYRHKTILKDLNLIFVLLAILLEMDVQFLNGKEVIKNKKENKGSSCFGTEY